MADATITWALTADRPPPNEDAVLIALRTDAQVHEGWYAPAMNSWFSADGWPLEGGDVPYEA